MELYTASLLTNWPDLLNPNVDPIDESNETSALDELLSRRSKEAQQNHEALAADPSTSPSQDAQNVGGQGVAELEAEAQGEGAFNPETGEINWDCPCLGGMAHGPCGPEFREAFSCFIYSEEEPKGMECIDKFQGMRDCFQRHPEVYKDELMEDEELDAELEAEKQELVNQIAERRRSDEAAATSGHRLLEEPAPASKSSKTLSKDDSTSSAKASVTQAVADVSATSQNQPQPEARATTDTDVRSEPVRENTIEGQNSDAAKSFMSDSVSHDTPPDEGDELVPKAAHDARETGRTGSHPPKGE